MERIKQGEFTWTDLSAKDLDSQSEFYEGLFGWTHEDSPMPDGSTYRMFHLDGRIVGGASQMNPQMASQGVPSMWNVYIAVDDVDAEVDRVVQLGGKVIVPPIDVMQRGRMAGVQDPTGGLVFLWHTNSPDAQETYMEPGSFSWADLETRDPGRASEFFTKLLGWDVQRLDQAQTPYWQVNVDGQGEGGIAEMPDMMPAQTPAFWLDYFGTTDIDASVRRAMDLGASVDIEPTQVADMLKFAVLEDPQGATFALLEPMGTM